jgi:hypothetical protein
MNTKELYRQFSREEPSLPIFSRDWWLDAAAGPDGWDVALVEKGNKVLATMPYMLRRRFGLNVLGQPALTQKMGPWLRPCEGSPAQKLASEKTLMQLLIDQLPAFDHFNQNWDYARSNWLPFSWNGFQQSTRYTYMLANLNDTGRLWAGFENSTRAECKKATERFKLQIRDDLPLDAFLALNHLTYRRQGISMPYSEALVRRLDAACAERTCRKFFIAVDSDGRYHAGNYFVWDECSSYGLMSGIDPSVRNSGGASLCMWKAILHAAQVTQRFDFAGSMLEPVERFFRGFGAAQVPYFNITKTPSRLLRIRQSLLSVFGGAYAPTSAGAC